MTRVVGGLAAAAITLAIAACGSGQLKPASGINSADQLLNQSAVNATSAGPERALYQWWLFIQYNDLSGYLGMLSPSLRAREVNSRLIGYELPVASRALDVAVPDVVSVSRTGTSATIYTLVAYHQLVGSTRYITVQAPQAFSLEQLGGRWYIADDQFVAEQSRSALVAAGVIPQRAAPASSSDPNARATSAATGQLALRSGSGSHP